MNQPSSLEADLEALKRALPLRAPIYLPTSRLSLEEQIRGLQKVKRLYEGRLDDVYRPKLEALTRTDFGRRRAFVVGNGPSLNKTDLSLLKTEVTFCTNSFYHKYDEIDWRPTFYMVEDHLVAEDNASELNALTGSTKLFPAYLAYCLNEGPATLFFDHRPRPSYPDGFDFSDDIAHCTYTGCTVTFTALQAAAAFGFEEIFLIGVDADYKIPDSVKRSDEYGVAVLDMDEDDPNHFSGAYFGRGKRWHDPQVDKMIEAYKQAKRDTEAKGRAILNATVGGRLEVFHRIDLEDVFEPDCAVFPRLVIIDMVPMGSAAASSQLKRRLFEPWPAGRVMSVSARGDTRFTLELNGFPEARVELSDAASLMEVLEAFGPEIMLNRPMAQRPHLMELANRLARDGLPMITWMMDDWVGQYAADPERVGDAGPALFEEAVGLSSGLWSISDEMSDLLKARYGREALPVANGIDEAEWEGVEPRGSGARTITFRFGGSLSPTMSAATLKAIAQVIEDLDAPVQVELIIKTSQYWRGVAGDGFDRFQRTRIEALNESESGYFQEVCDADVNIIAYNFDDETDRYCRTSLGNKLPELLRAGRPILAVGPEAFATLRRLDRAEAHVVHTDALEDIEQVVSELVTNFAVHDAAARRNSALAREAFAIEPVRSKVNTDLRARARPRRERAAVSELVSRMQALSIKQNERAGGGAPPAPGALARMGSGLRAFAGYLSGWRLAALALAFAAKAFALAGQTPYSAVIGLGGDALIVFTIFYSLAQLHGALKQR